MSDYLNISAFLTMIAWSELGQSLIDASDNGYNVIVGSRPGRIRLFHDYSDHPGTLVKINDKISSTAAGRYQILKRYFDHYKKLMHLPDFSPDSQDKIAIRMITEQGALDDILNGHIEDAIAKVSNIWASFPGAGYGQHEQTSADLLAIYHKKGGMLA